MSPRRLGQHFLADAGWRARITRTLGCRAEDVWLEIGAGHGEMTRELARRAARVVAVELDAPLVERLRALSKELPNIEVVARDILRLDIGRLLRADRFRVYGNLPYYITSPILHRLFEFADRLESIHLVMQLEVAERLVAQPGRREYGYLSVLTQFHSRPEILLRIPPGAFRPPPKVQSALVQFRLPGAGAPVNIGNESTFLEFVKMCFEQKRKTLLNNLKRRMPAERAAAVLQRAELPPNTRAEQLSLAQFAELYRQAEWP